MTNALDDEIFLLSYEDYTKHQDFIPVSGCPWWLSNSGRSQRYFYSVSNSRLKQGEVFVDVESSDKETGVRPAFEVLENDSKFLKPGDICIKYGMPCVYVGDNLLVSECILFNSAMGFRPKNYEQAPLRHYLCGEWLSERIKNFNEQPVIDADNLCGKEVNGHDERP